MKYRLRKTEVFLQWGFSYFFQLLSCWTHKGILICWCWVVWCDLQWGDLIQYSFGSEPLSYKHWASRVRYCERPVILLYSCLTLEHILGKCWEIGQFYPRFAVLHQSMLPGWEVTCCIKTPSQKGLLTFWPTGFPITISLKLLLRLL